MQVLRVVHYPTLSSYRRRIVEAAGLFLFGMFFFAVSVPAWFLNVPLPHPLVGLWCMGYAYFHLKRMVARDRDLKIEILDLGLRHDATQISWSEVMQLDVGKPSVINRLSFVRSKNASIEIPTDWPGHTEIVAAAIQHAHLHRVRGGWWSSYEVYAPPAMGPR